MQRYYLPKSPTPEKIKPHQNRVNLMMDAFREDLIHHESLPNDMSNDVAGSAAEAQESSQNYYFDSSSPANTHQNYEADLSDFERWERRCDQESFDIQEAVQNDAILAKNRFNQNIINMGDSDQMLLNEQPPNDPSMNLSMRFDSAQQEGLRQSPRNYSLEQSQDASRVYPDHAADLSDFERWEQRCNESFDVDEALKAEAAQQAIEGHTNIRNSSRNLFNQHSLGIDENQSQIFDENEPNLFDLDASMQFPQIYSPPPSKTLIQVQKKFFISFYLILIFFH